MVVSTNAAQNATHCDIHIYKSDKDARSAIARIGGDSRVSEPRPLKVLQHVAVSDAHSLTEEWHAPPWEPPSFRTLVFKPREMPGLDTDALLASPRLASQPASGGFDRIAWNSPKEQRDRFWNEWRHVNASRRAAHEAPWRANSTPSSPHVVTPSHNGSLRYAATVRGYIGRVANQVVEVLTPRRSPGGAPPSPKPSNSAANASAAETADAADAADIVEADTAAADTAVAHSPGTPAPAEPAPAEPAPAEPDWKPLIS